MDSLLAVDGTTITAGTLTVDLTTVASDQARPDAQFNGRIMETATYPTATFKLTEPIELGSIAAAGTQRTFKATGELTLHGVTRTVTFSLTGRYTGLDGSGCRLNPHTSEEGLVADGSLGLFGRSRSSEVQGELQRSVVLRGDGSEARIADVPSPRR